MTRGLPPWDNYTIMEYHYYGQSNESFELQGLLDIRVKRLRVQDARKCWQESTTQAVRGLEYRMMTGITSDVNAQRLCLAHKTRIETRATSITFTIGKFCISYVILKHSKSTPGFYIYISFYVYSLLQTLLHTYIYTYAYVYVYLTSIDHSARHIPFLKHLAQQGLISESHGRSLGTGATEDI